MGGGVHAIYLYTLQRHFIHKSALGWLGGSHTHFHSDSDFALHLFNTENGGEHV